MISLIGHLSHQVAICEYHNSRVARPHLNRAPFEKVRSMFCRTMTLILVVACLIVCLGEPPTQASEFSHRLPIDGTWCKYFVNTTIAGIKADSAWIVSSVGRKTVNGEACRWIEFRHMSSDEQQTVRVVKVLVLEEAFGPEKNPGEGIREVWIKLADSEPMQSEVLPYFERFALMAVDGPTNDVRQIEKKQAVVWQGGKLKCDVFTGSSGVESKAEGLKVKLTHRVLVHDQVPFRTAGSSVHFEIQVFGQDVTADADFTFVDSGRDAESALPDVK